MHVQGWGIMKEIKPFSRETTGWIAGRDQSRSSTMSYSAQRCQNRYALAWGRAKKSYTPQGRQTRHALYIYVRMYLQMYHPSESNAAKKIVYFPEIISSVEKVPPSKILISTASNQAKDIITACSSTARHHTARHNCPFPQSPNMPGRTSFNLRWRATPVKKPLGSLKYYSRTSTHTHTHTQQNRTDSTWRNWVQDELEPVQAFIAGKHGSIVITHGLTQCTDNGEGPRMDKLFIRMY